MCTNMFVWLLKILCQTCIAFDQDKIIYDKKKYELFPELYRCIIYDILSDSCIILY